MAACGNAVRSLQGERADVTDVGLLVAALNKGATAWLVSVKSTEGSAPREPGAWMAVLADRVIGTIGGGHLEHQAMADARRRLEGEPGEPQVRYALGPALGQCCGRRSTVLVHLLLLVESSPPRRVLVNK